MVVDFVGDCLVGLSSVDSDCFVDCWGAVVRQLVVGCCSDAVARSMIVDCCYIVDLSPVDFVGCYSADNYLVDCTSGCFDCCSRRC